MIASQTSSEKAEQRTVPDSLLEKGRSLIVEHSDCFWYFHPDARIETWNDLRLIVKKLRQHGNRNAWYAAQDLNQCLLQFSKKRS